MQLFCSKELQCGMARTSHAAPNVTSRCVASQYPPPKDDGPADNQAVMNYFERVIVSSVQALKLL